MGWLKIVRNRRYAERVRRTRRDVKAGDSVAVLRDGVLVLGRVLNVRHYEHGAKEVYVQSNDSSMARWVGVDSLFPYEGRLF